MHGYCMSPVCGLNHFGLRLLSQALNVDCRGQWANLERCPSYQETS